MKEDNKVQTIMLQSEWLSKIFTVDLIDDILIKKLVEVFRSWCKWSLSQQLKDRSVE